MRKGGEGGGWGAGVGTTLSNRPPNPRSTEVFICTSPLMKYDHCVHEKVRLPQHFTRRLRLLSPDLLKKAAETETVGGGGGGVEGSHISHELL